MLSTRAQIRPYTPYQGKGFLLQADNYQFNKFLRIPVSPTTTPGLNNVIDSVGAGFQLLSNGSLAVSKGLGTGYWLFQPSEVESTIYQNIVIVDVALTTAQTSATLNAKYPSVKISTMVFAPGVGTGMFYIKRTSTQWSTWTTSNI